MPPPMPPPLDAITLRAYNPNTILIPDEALATAVRHLNGFSRLYAIAHGTLSGEDPEAVAQFGPVLPDALAAAAAASEPVGHILQGHFFDTGLIACEGRTEWLDRARLRAAWEDGENLADHVTEGRLRIPLTDDPQGLCLTLAALLPKDHITLAVGRAAMRVPPTADTRAFLWLLTELTDLSV